MWRNLMQLFIKNIFSLYNPIKFFGHSVPKVTSEPGGWGGTRHSRQILLIGYASCWTICSIFNTLRPKQNGRHCSDDIFKCIFFNENAWISIKISLKFVPKGPINKIPALVQIMAWRWSGDKPLSEPMMVNSLTHICVTRPQWVKAHGMRFGSLLSQYLPRNCTHNNLVENIHDHRAAHILIVMGT